MYRHQIDLLLFESVDIARNFEVVIVLGDLILIPSPCPSPGGRGDILFVFDHRNHPNLPRGLSTSYL
jgi:hypothetical protein